MAEVFYLAVFSAVEVQHAVFVKAAEVACFVYQLAVLVVERVLHEHLIGLLMVAVVAKREDGTRHADLALFALRCGGVVLIQQENAVVVIGLADGKHGVVVHLFLNDVVGAACSRLGGTVLVDIQNVGQVLLPDLQIFAGHYRAGEAELFEVFGLANVKSAQLCGDLNARYAPAQRGYLFAVERFKQRSRNGELVFRDDVGRRAEAYRQVDIPYCGDVVERALIAERVGIVDAQHLCHRVDIAHKRLMRGDNALGYSRRARGEYNVKGRGAHKRALSLAQKLLVGLSVKDVLHDDDLSVKVERSGGLKVSLVNKHYISLYDAADLIQPCLRHVAVHRRVKAARANRAQKAGGGHDVSARHNGNGSSAGNKLCQCGADDLCQRVELAEGDLFVLILEHDLVGVFLRSFIKSVKNRCFHINPHINKYIIPSLLYQKKT